MGYKEYISESIDGPRAGGRGNKELQESIKGTDKNGLINLQ